MAGKGGAWKVAYADFVTAMMALFMVLWIAKQDSKIVLATARYFQSPFNAALTETSGLMPFDTKNNSSNRPGESGSESRDSSARSIDLQFLNSVAHDFMRSLHVENDAVEKPIDIQVTSDGLRLTLFDRARLPLFHDNTAEFTDWGGFVMQNLAWTIDRHKFHVVIEGHTRRGLVLPDEGYSAWELSADRANAARRALTHYAVDARAIDRVTGFADTRPVPNDKPESESNQRVTLSLSMARRPKEKPTDAEAQSSSSMSAPAATAPAH